MEKKKGGTATVSPTSLGSAAKNSELASHSRGRNPFHAGCFLDCTRSAGSTPRGGAAAHRRRNAARPRRSPRRRRRAGGRRRPRAAAGRRPRGAHGAVRQLERADLRESELHARILRGRRVPIRERRLPGPLRARRADRDEPRAREVRPDGREPALRVPVRNGRHCADAAEHGHVLERLRRLARAARHEHSGLRRPVDPGE